MKILIATPLLPTQSGGPAQYAVGLKQSLEATGCQVDIIAFQEVSRYPTLIRHAVLFFKMCFRVSEVDAIIVLDTLSMALPAVLVGVLFRKKVVVRVGGDFVWERYVERTREKVQLSKFYKDDLKLSIKERIAFWVQIKVVVPFASVLVFSTEWQRDIWSIPYRLAGKRVSIIENAYCPRIVAMPPSKSPRTIVWVGRNIVLKNSDMLDKAIGIVKHEFPSIEYKKYSDVSHDEVIRILSNSRMLVVPSLSEVSPNVVLEALALQVPVLLTSDCGFVHILEHAVTWIDPLDAENIASRIKEVMSDDGYAQARAKITSFKCSRTYNEVAEEFFMLLRQENAV